MEFYDVFGETPEIENEILINGVEYSYSIIKSEKDRESLIIKLYDSTHKTDIFFTYEASIETIRKELTFLDSFDNLDEMIYSLNNIFSQGNSVVKENKGNFNLEIKFFEGRKTKKYIILLIKHEPKKNKNELEDKLDKLEITLNNVLIKFKKLKTEKENINKEDYMKYIIQEIINDKSTIFKLYEEIEQLFLSKYRTNNIYEQKKDKLENKIMNKIENKINIEEEKVDNNKNLIKKEQIEENLNKNEIKEESKVNYNQNISKNNTITKKDIDDKINEIKEDEDLKLNKFKKFENLQVEKNKIEEEYKPKNIFIKNDLEEKKKAKIEMENKKNKKKNDKDNWKNKKEKKLEEYQKRVLELKIKLEEEKRQKELWQIKYNQINNYFNDKNYKKQIIKQELKEEPEFSYFEQDNFKQRRKINSNTYYNRTNPNLLNYNLAKDSINSKIVNSTDIIFIQNRIKEIHPKIKEVFFNLVYRASEDGDKADDFHKKCDKIGPNIVLIKTRKGNIFGGFTYKNWEHLPRDIDINRPSLGSAS